MLHANRPQIRFFSSVALRSKPAVDHGHLRLRLRESDSGFEPANHISKLLIVGPQWNEQRNAELNSSGAFVWSRAEHAYDSVRFILDENELADDLGICMVA